MWTSSAGFRTQRNHLPDGITVQSRNVRALVGDRRRTAQLLEVRTGWLPLAGAGVSADSTSRFCAPGPGGSTMETHARWRCRLLRVPNFHSSGRAPGRSLSNREDPDGSAGKEFWVGLRTGRSGCGDHWVRFRDGRQRTGPSPRRREAVARDLVSAAAVLSDDTTAVTSTVSRRRAPNCWRWSALNTRVSSRPGDSLAESLVVPRGSRISFRKQRVGMCG